MEKKPNSMKKLAKGLLGVAFAAAVAEDVSMHFYATDLRQVAETAAVSAITFYAMAEQQHQVIKDQQIILALQQRALEKMARESQSGSAGNSNDNKQYMNGQTTAPRLEYKF